MRPLHLSFSAIVINSVKLYFGGLTPGLLYVSIDSQFNKLADILASVLLSWYNRRLVCPNLLQSFSRDKISPIKRNGNTKKNGSCGGRSINNRYKTKAD